MNLCKIYILTCDDYCHVIEYYRLQHSDFFKTLVKKNSGNFSSPIFLQDITNSYFEIVLIYLTHFDMPQKELKRIKSEIQLKIKNKNLNMKCFKKILQLLQIKYNKTLLVY
jgi:hypothetical protein